MNSVLKIMLLIFLVSPAPCVATTLSEFISSVKTANPDLQELKSQVRSEKLRADASGYWEDPFFGVGPDEVQENDSNSGMMRYQISQTIPFPGRLSSRKKSAEAQVHAAEANATSSEREIVVIAAQLYARAFFTQKAIAVNREQQKLLSDLISSTRARYKSGSGEHHEYVLAQIETSTLAAEYLRLNRELKVLKAKMNEMIAAESDAVLELQEIEIKELAPKSFEESVKDQPELLAAEARVEASSAEVQSAKLSYFPDIVLQGMYMKPRGMGMDSMGVATEEPAQWGAMIGFTIPIFSFGKQGNLASAAKALQDASATQQKIIQRRLRTEWVEAEAQLQTAEDLVRLYKSEVVPNTQLAAQTGKAAYVARRLPLSQFIEVLRVQRTQALELTAAEIDVSMAKLRKIYLLSRAPVFRLAPMRPTLFGSGSMGTMDNSMSGSVNMGSGMRTPGVQKKTSPDSGSSSGGMEGM